VEDKSTKPKKFNILRSAIQNIEANVYNPKTLAKNVHKIVVEASWNVMEHAQKTDFFFRRNGQVHLNRRGRQFSRLLAAEVFASAVVMLDTPCSEVVWRELATHSIRHFLLHFSSRASPCAITFQLESNNIIIHYRSTQLTSVPTDRGNSEQLIRRRRLKQQLATFKIHPAISNYAHFVFLFPTFGLCRMCQYTECTEMRTILNSSKYRLHLCNIKNHLTEKGLNKLVQLFLMKHDVSVPKIQ
jgi:hypothetical protein